MWEIDLTGSTALVTGASRGIGRAIAVGLSTAGADVVGLARSEGPLAELSDKIEEIGRSYLPLVGDLGDGAAIPGLAEEAWSWKGSIDILVNAAGMVIRRDPPDVTIEDFDLMMAVNVRAPFLMSQEIGRRMHQAGSGSIINIASVAGEEVTPAPLHYQAGKAALIHMTRGFASRLAPKVRVNAVGPGYIRTALNAEWLSDEGNQRYVEERTASRRVGIPGDVVGAVVFLASSAASYVNGQHLRVDGGWGI